jgi:rhodanese-related sulfurtransferase
MPIEVERHEVQRLVDRGAQLVDVMSASEYASTHIAGAVNVPLDRLAEWAPQMLDRTRGVITYCYDSL